MSTLETPEVIDPEESLQPEVVHLPAAIPKTVPGLSDVPIVPARAEFEGLVQMAVTLAGSGLCPSALRGKPQDVFVVLMTARDLGIALSTALREIHVIEGKATVSPKLKQSLVNSRGLGKMYPHQAPRFDPVRQEEVLCPCGSRDKANDAESATWHGERHDTPGVVYTVAYNINMAGGVKTKITERNGNQVTKKDGFLTDKENWQNYPERMLSARAKGYLIDDTFPEVGTGLYSPDELGAVTDLDGNPIIDLDGAEDPFAAGNPSRGAPSDPEPNPDQFEALKLAIAKVTADPKARAYLAAKWTEEIKHPDDSMQPRLPPLPRLRHRHMVVANALVADVQKRLDRGEFAEGGTVTEDAPPVEPEKPSEPVSAGDTPTEPAAAPEAHTPLTMGDLNPTPVDAVVERSKRVTAWCTGMPIELVEALGEQHGIVLDPSKEEAVVRVQVAAKLLAAKWDPDQADPQWRDLMPVDG